MEEKGWSIFNGNCKGDEVGEYTFTGERGCTVIDYVMGDSEVRERIAEMKIGDKIDSDHQPIEVMIKGTGMKRRGERGLEKCWRGVWNEKGRREFKECIDTIEMREREIREDWREMEERFKEAMETAERKIVRSRKKGDEWWDEECKKKKREVRRELRLMRRAAIVMGQVWNIGKRRFGKDWERRIWLFDKLVWTVLGYGVEIWGWKERECIERLEKRYLRWILGVDSRTPGYLVREELQRDKLRGRAGRRAWGFKRRLEEERGSELARKCWEELRERERGGVREERGGRKKEECTLRIEVGWVYEEIEKRERKRQKEERWERIMGSNYSRNREGSVPYKLTTVDIDCGPRPIPSTRRIDSRLISFALSGRVLTPSAVLDFLDGNSVSVRPHLQGSRWSRRGVREGSREEEAAGRTIRADGISILIESAISGRLFSHRAGHMYMHVQWLHSQRGVRTCRGITELVSIAGTLPKISSHQVLQILMLLILLHVK
ncbi:hypothetical protein X777_13093 [Ooceraea biroi]|uniref:Endonuclease/exonuclease/phosphatase domain-containing protein n=1 Tax=Ooceraea biroi TaxID=2015173 RepID=A0A026WYP6_OOCBI|nr:hypothetical protein X777_13093 [Ooceraea biroi]